MIPPGLSKLWTFCSIPNLLPIFFKIPYDMYRRYNGPFRLRGIKISTVNIEFFAFNFPFLFAFFIFERENILWVIVSKVIIEKLRGGRFLWNRNWDLGWIWAGLATFEASFFMFSRAKKELLKILHCRQWKHFWHRMKLKKIFFFLKKLKKKLG